MSRTHRHRCSRGRRRPARGAAGAARLDLRRPVRALPRRPRGHAAPRDRPDRRRLARRAADRPLAARAAAAASPPATACSRRGAAFSNASPATACRRAARAPPARAAARSRRSSSPTAADSQRNRHVDEIVGPPRVAEAATCRPRRSAAARARPPPRAPASSGRGAPRRCRDRPTRCCGAEHLGAYAPLIGADPRRARALRRQPCAPARRHRRARPLRADVDRRPLAGRRRGARRCCSSSCTSSSPSRSSAISRAK